MSERFADRARQAVVLAQEEARRLGHPEVGTEHILLGLVREGESGAAQVLAGRGADLDAVRQEVARQLAAGGGDRAAAKPSKEAMVADIEALYGELDGLSGEVARLRGLLRHHGIEPDQGTTRSA